MKSFPVLLALICGLASAAEPQEGPVLAPVQVTAQRDPVEKSYRKIVRGMDLFEQRRASLAPNAALRFKLLPRNRETRLQGVALSIVGDTVDIPVPLAPDNTFTLERSQKALQEDAVVTPNRKQHSMSWRTDVRTPGLAPNTRRLGDLRLECLVGMEAELVSGSGSIVESIARAISDAGYCNQRVPEYFFFAERALWSVTLVSGGRRELLSIDYMYAGMSREYMTAGDLRYCDCATLLDRTYYAPLGDRSWPDDTLLVFEYMDERR
ncbi:MAG TPA: hypothetical protein VHP37_13105 [Burkholderiales bacterium]|nr:hypothetical protein [Burkholderiales bacterium]